MFHINCNTTEALLNDKNYWLGTAASDTEVYYIEGKTGEIKKAEYTTTGYAIRPVVEILKKSLASSQIIRIKATANYDMVERKVNIEISYTKNGVGKILDENGNEMSFEKIDGVIYATTGDRVIPTGTHTYKIIDKKNYVTELRVTVDSTLFKVAYINGTDNMDNTVAYTKSKETITSNENTLLNQVKQTDTTKTFNRAIQDSNKAITAIGQQTRTSEDEKMYMYGKYNANSKTTYSLTESKDYTEYTLITYHNAKIGYKNYSFSATDGKVNLSNTQKIDGSAIYDCAGYPTVYSPSSTLENYDRNAPSSKTITKTFYKFVFLREIDVLGSADDGYVFKRYTMTINKNTTYSRGTFDSNIIALDGTYPRNDRSGSYWYVRNNLAPKYTLYKYDENLNLKSKYDVDTQSIITEPIDISHKGTYKVKMKTNISGTNCKAYTSSDGINWGEGILINSGTITTELPVEEGWNTLYIKIETKADKTKTASRVNSIDVAYYKD